MRVRATVACLLSVLLLSACNGETKQAVESPSPSPSPSPTPAFPTEQATVTNVVDGDTADATLPGGKSERIRFIGVDTPERGRPYFDEASNFTRERIAGKPVFLQYDAEQRDSFGRLLAYVWLTQPFTGDDVEIRGSMFNAVLLLEGFAQPLTVPPNVKYADAFNGYSQEARNANKGLWAIPPSPSPAPPPPPPPPKASPKAGNCHPSYPDVCIPPPPPDLDCGEISHRRFRVLHNVADPDPHGFDNDKDGIGCESG